MRDLSGEQNADEREKKRYIYNPLPPGRRLPKQKHNSKVPHLRIPLFNPPPARSSALDLVIDAASFLYGVFFHAAAIAPICVFFLLFQEPSQLEFLDVRHVALFNGREADRWTSVLRWLVLWDACVCVVAAVGIEPY